MVAMEQLISSLRALCGAAGVAGAESSAQEVACRLLRQYIPDASCDSFGNVSGLLPSRKAGAKTLLLDAHLDEIGMIVTAIDDRGFLRFSKCGGIDLRLLSAQIVTVHGKEPLRGVIGSVPPHLQKAGEAKKAPELEDLFVDVGLSRERAEELISPGDRITIDTDLTLLLNHRVTSKALDDRSGCASILAALELLKGQELDVNLAVQFTAQEETGARGAAVSAFRLEPDLAIAVDVSFAWTPDEDKLRCGPLGGGPLIGYAAALDKEISDRLVSLAKEKEIPYHLEVMGGSSTGTNADNIAVSRRGVRVGLISIPERYMHTPVEVVDLEDIQNTARLMAEFVRIGGSF